MVFNNRTGDISTLDAHAVVACNNENFTDIDPQTTALLERAGPELRQELAQSVKGYLVSACSCAVVFHSRFITPSDIHHHQWQSIVGNMPVDQSSSYVQALDTSSLSVSQKISSTSPR
jgi:hypothetical protein